MRILKHKTIFLLAGLLLCLVFNAAPAHAQKKHLSSQEKGLIAFYKLSNLTPDFGLWIDRNAFFKSLPQPEQEAHIAEEKLRLQWGLGTYDPNKDLLSIETKVLGTYIEQNGKAYIAARFEINRPIDDIQFPYNVNDIWVSAILKDLEHYMTMEISEDKRALVKQQFGADGAEIPLTLNARYKAVSALEKPVVLDNVEQYIMMGEIAYWGISIDDKNNGGKNLKLWEYYAPWYMDEDEIHLMELLESR